MAIRSWLTVWANHCQEKVKTAMKNQSRPDMKEHRGFTSRWWNRTILSLHMLMRMARTNTLLCLRLVATRWTARKSLIRRGWPQSKRKRKAMEQTQQTKLFILWLKLVQNKLKTHLYHYPRPWRSLTVYFKNKVLSWIVSRIHLVNKVMKWMRKK